MSFKLTKTGRSILLKTLQNVSLADAAEMSDLPGLRDRLDTVTVEEGKKVTEYVVTAQDASGNVTDAVRAGTVARWCTSYAETGKTGKDGWKAVIFPVKGKVRTVRESGKGKLKIAL